MLPFILASDTPSPVAWDRIERFYHEHRVAIYYMALSIVRKPDVAQDVMQTVFLRMIETGVDPAVIRYPRAWAAAAAHNAAVDSLRRQARDVSVGEVVIPEYFDSAEDGGILDAALSRLNGEERRMFTMHFVEGFRYREIAEVFGRKTGTVRMICNRTRGKLKTILKEMGAEQP